MRRSSGDLASVVTVLAIPMAIASAFPFSAVGFRAQPAVTRPSTTVAFVRLSEKEESQALRASRSSLKGVDADVRRLHVDLFFPDLPGSDRTEILPASARSLRTEVPVVECPVGPYLPSLQAPTPSVIPAEPMSEEPPFSRQELLKTD